MDINSLDFSQESQAIVSELTNMLADESTITLDSITNLHTKMAVVLNKLNTAME
jgi:CheY-specific phosphatase CheX